MCKSAKLSFFQVEMDLCGFLACCHWRAILLYHWQVPVHSEIPDVHFLVVVSEDWHEINRVQAHESALQIITEQDKPQQFQWFNRI